MAISMSVSDVDELLGNGSSDDDKKKLKQTQTTQASQALPRPVTQPAAQAAAAPMAAPLPPKQTLPAPIAPPEIPNAAPAALPAPGALGGGLPQPKKPTPKQSVAAGMAENGTNAKEEGKAQYEAGRPEVTSEPGTIEYGQERQAQLDYDKQHPLGSDISKNNSVWGKIEHGLAKAGNIAGDIVAPNTMALIPGTDLNNSLKAKGNASWIQMGAENQQKEATAENQAADAWVKLHPKDKAVGGPQITGDGELEQEFQRPDGSSHMVDLGVRGKPNVQLVKTYDNGVPTVNAVNKNQPGAAPVEVGAGKPVNAPVKTLPMTDPTDKKVYDYQYDNSGQQGPEHWKKIGVAKPDAVTLGEVGTWNPQYSPQGEVTGYVNSKNPKLQLDANANPAKAGTLKGAPNAGVNIAKGTLKTFNSDYEKPAETVEEGYQKFEDANKDYKAGKTDTGAASMVALSTHLATTFGSVKGARLNKDLIAEHKDAIGWIDKMERYGESISSGQQLSASQWKDFETMITNTRNISWQIAAKEALRSKLPEDSFPAIPSSVQIQMRTPKGTTVAVRGNQVKEAVKDGLTVE